MTLVPVEVLGMPGRRQTTLCGSLLLWIGLSLVPNAAAAPAGAAAGGNVTRFAQASWTTTHGERQVRWLLTAFEIREASTWREPASHTAQLTLSKLICGARGPCRVGGPSWRLDEGDFVFDATMDRVRVTVPGSVRLVWRATAGYQIVSGRHVARHAYGDPADYVGAGAGAVIVSALRRPARVAGRIDGYPGRLQVDTAYIYLWSGGSAWAEACLADEGRLCL